MNGEKSIIVKRDCSAVMIPSGETTTLPAGSSVWVTQSLGGAYTVMTDRGYMARIDGTDGDALKRFFISEVQLLQQFRQHNDKTDAGQIGAVIEVVENVLSSDYSSNTRIRTLSVARLYQSCFALPFLLRDSLLQRILEHLL